MRGAFTFLAALAAAAPAGADFGGTPLPDAELAAITGKFMLSNGASIAMSVTSDTLVDGHIILRSVLTIDNAASLRVFTGSPPAAGAPAATRPAGQSPAMPSGVTVLFDRESGTRTVVPTYATAPAVAVTTNARTAATDTAAAGLTPVTVTPGGSVATPVGTVSVAPSGSAVMLAGDRLDVTHLLGPGIGTAVANTASDRTIDNATSVDINLARTTSFAVGGAALRVSDMALDATRGMVR